MKYVEILKKICSEAFIIPLVQLLHWLTDAKLTIFFYNETPLSSVNDGDWYY